MKICEIFEDQSTSVLPYGYWITSEGTIIPVKEVMGHGRYTKNGTSDALQHGWIRIVVNGNRYMSSHNRVLYVQIWSRQNYSKTYIPFERLCEEILDHHIFNSIMIEYQNDFEEFEGKNFIKDAAMFIKNYGKIVESVMTDDKNFMFIEPKSKKTNEVNDEITEFVANAMQKVRSNNDRTKGHHKCRCGERSTNVTYKIRLGNKTYNTNSLALHYVKFHRDEVPESEMDKIKKAMVLKEDGGRFVQGVNSTVDVHAGTMKHNASRFGNDVDDDGVPPLIKTNGARPDKIMKKHSYSAPVDQRDIPSNPSNPKPSQKFKKKTKI